MGIFGDDGQSFSPVFTKIGTQGAFMGLWMIKGFLANINMKAKNKVKGSHVVRCRTAPCVVDNWPYILQTEKKNRPKIFTFFFFRCGSPKSARGFLYACRLKFCTQNETIYTNNHIKQSKNPNHWNYITPFKSDIQWCCITHIRWHQLMTPSIL